MNLKQFYTGRAIGFIVVIAIVLGIFALAAFLPKPAQTPQSGLTTDASLVITNSEIPEGWKILAKDDSSLVLEREGVIVPGIGTTTQRIRIYAKTFKGTPKEWIKVQMNLGDPLVYDYLWDDINGVKHLRVTHQTQSDDAQDDYYFGNGRVVYAIFQPLQSLQNLPDTKTRDNYQKFLNEVVEPRVDPNAGEWQTYTNTVYGYTLMYPRNAMASQISEEERVPVEKSVSVSIFTPGGSVTRMSIETYISYGGELYPLIQVHNDLVALPLQQFAAYIRQDQVDDTNPNMKDRQIGALTETTFAGHKAYSFTLTDGFTKEFAGSGYALPQGVTINFVAVENSAGIKLLIGYPLNDDATAKMKDSFKFSN